ncbi:MAG: PadR family transcriptional regulator [Planctomycetota bacterium]
MSIKHALLGLLASGGPQHGYELKMAYETTLAPTASLNVGPLNFGQVYQTLDRLKREGSVRQELVAQNERPDKKVYSISPEGRRRLKTWLAEPTALDLDQRHPLYLKVALARRVRGTDALSLVRRERHGLADRLEEIRHARRRAQRRPDAADARMLLDLSELRLEALHKWLERCEQRIRKENAG